MKCYFLVNEYTTPVFQLYTIANNDFIGQSYIYMV